jgi:hypothetical protein
MIEYGYLIFLLILGVPIGVRIAMFWGDKIVRWGEHTHWICHGCWKTQYTNKGICVDCYKLRS